MPSKPKLQRQAQCSVFGLNGSRGHGHEARGRTRLKPGLSQMQVTTATPVKLDFRRMGISGEGCAGTMPTDSPCSVAQDAVSDQGRTTTTMRMPSASVFNVGCFEVAIGDHASFHLCELTQESEKSHDEWRCHETVTADR